MARAIWKGYVSFGLVNVPVELHTAERRKELSFKLVDNRDQARVRYQRVNEATGEEVPWGNVVKAFEYREDNYVLLGDEDFKKVAVKANKTIEIQDFVDRDQIDVIYYDRPYYLLPLERGRKGYVLLREALERAKKVGIAKVVIRTREHLCALLPRGPGLMVMLLRFQEEILDTKDFDFPQEKPEAYKISAKEIKLAEQLVETMTSPWKPDSYLDDYRKALMEWIEVKAERGDTAAVPAGTVEETEDEPQIINLMEILKKSVEAKRGGRPATRRSGATRQVTKRPLRRKRA